MPANSREYSKFAELFREHYNALANYAFAILKNKQDAEDIVQDVFIKLWQNKPGVIETPQIKFYLLTSTKNGCISFLRKQAGKIIIDPETVSLHSTTGETAEIQVEDIQEFVNKALSLLPPQCLVIFKLSRFGQLTYQQIADELGLSVKTVENQMGKALRIMRNYARENNISFSLMICFLFCSWYC